MHREMTDIGPVIMIMVKMEILNREVVMRILEIEDKVEVPSEAI